ncbi:unnamed protein product [Kluyveromyces dobzhanskii CBS 2104]|uniref:WGS project CCBQ000000000 data, contig 00107 n=1 Tax=Kluyveromyces dobzhanskii CBS 2104 TaxID=1427455 RepID=A0A0A8KZ43_9SACH|nr:unnamed protein product [Kluyveromyces dobzhanskii CBS 2104]
MDDDLYDEFGQFLGFPQEFTSYEQSSEEVQGEAAYSTLQGDLDQEATDVVLRDANGNFDDDVEVLLEVEDREPDKPLVAGDLRPKGYDKCDKIPKAMFDREYLQSILAIPERQLNVGIFGPLHSGKTSFADMFALDTHHNLPSLTKKVKEGWLPFKYLDQERIEKERGVSLRLNGMTFGYESSRGRTYAVTMLDTPGHVNFWDDVGITLTCCQYGIVVIDVAEGVTSVVLKLFKELEQNGIEFIVVLNKIDRLALDLRLPADAAYWRLLHIVEQVNRHTKETFSPELGNVLFSSTKFGFVFSIESFVNSFYAKSLKDKTEQFVARLWGLINYWDGEFNETEFISERNSFFVFILQPLYKVITHGLSASAEELQRVIKDNFQVNLSDETLSKDPQPLLFSIFRSIFPHHHCVIDSISRLRDRSFDISANDGETLVHVLRHIKVNGTNWSLCRIAQGSLITGRKLYIFNESVDSIVDHADDEYPKITIERIALMGGRYAYEVKEAQQGQLVLLKGFEDEFTKFATLSSTVRNPLPPINYLNESVFKFAIQPQKPSDLPRLLHGLQLANGFYPSLVVRVEESGENIIVGTGELYLDCVMDELRKTFCEIEIKISQPLVQITESCNSESFASIPVKSNNGIVSISVMAEKLDDKIVHDLTHGEINLSELNNVRKFSKRLRTEYGWDSLAARNFWGLSQCNVFVDDTLPDETDKKLLKRYKEYILQGFEWAVKEGPLADERMHACQFKLLELKVQEDKIDEFIPSQLVPLTRKACYIALMTAAPIVMEPIYEVDIVNVQGTPFTEIKAQLPVIESIGFETDLRTATIGKGMCQMHFWNKIWRRVPGDVLDEEAFIPKLKPAPAASLSRDFVVKTRRRKGLSESGHMTQDGPSLKNYIDDELFEKLKQKGLV